MLWKIALLHSDNVDIKTKKVENQLTNSETSEEHLCNFCSKAFGEKRYLTRHIKTVHEKSKNYVCNICRKQGWDNKAFVSKSKLKRMSF